VQYADGATEGGVSGVAFSDQVAVATRLTQGCAPVGPEHTITDARHNILISLDGRPALDVFREDIGRELASNLSLVAGRIFAGLPVEGTDTGDYVVRNLVGLDSAHKLVAIGENVVHPDRELAINPGRVFGPINGLVTRDPAFGMEAVWIEPNLREHAQSLGYTVVDSATVIATHLSHLIQSHAHELFGHEEAEQLLKNLAKTAPKLVDELIPKVLPLAVVVRVMQGLLAERVPIRNVRAIVEALAEAGPRSQDPIVLIGQVRVALGRQIVQDIVGLAEELPVITLEPELERLLSNGLANSAAGPGLEPGLAERLQRGLSEAAQRQERGGEPAVLLTPPALRTALARFFRVSVPGLHVLAWNEVPDNRKVRMVTAIGAR